MIRCQSCGIGIAPYLTLCRSCWDTLRCSRVGAFSWMDATQPVTMPVEGKATEQAACAASPTISESLDTLTDVLTPLLQGLLRERIPE